MEPLLKAIIKMTCIDTFTMHRYLLIQQLFNNVCIEWRKDRDGKSAISVLKMIMLDAGVVQPPSQQRSL